jgi:hypothetical protein
MHAFLRRLRGLIGLSVFTGTAWALGGLVLGIVVALVAPALVDAGEGPGWIALYFWRTGLVAGEVAGLVLSAVERNRDSAALRLPRLASWGHPRRGCIERALTQTSCQGSH